MLNLCQYFKHCFDIEPCCEISLDLFDHFHSLWCFYNKVRLRFFYNIPFTHAFFYINDDKPIDFIYFQIM